MNLRSTNHVRGQADGEDDERRSGENRRYANQRRAGHRFGGDACDDLRHLEVDEIDPEQAPPIRLIHGQAQKARKPDCGAKVLTKTAASPR